MLDVVCDSLCLTGRSWITVNYAWCNSLGLTRHSWIIVGYTWCAMWFAVSDWAFISHCELCLMSDSLGLTRRSWLIVSYAWVWCAAMTTRFTLGQSCAAWACATSRTAPTLCAPCWWTRMKKCRRHTSFWSKWRRKSSANYSMVSLHWLLFDFACFVFVAFWGGWGYSTSGGLYLGEWGAWLVGVLDGGGGDTVWLAKCVGGGGL